MSECMSDQVPNRMPDGMSEYMSVRMPVIMSEYVSGNHSKKVMFVVCHMLIETGYIYIYYI